MKEACRGSIVGQWRSSSKKRDKRAIREQKSNGNADLQIIDLTGLEKHSRCMPHFISENKTIHLRLPRVRQTVWHHTNRNSDHHRRVEEDHQRKGDNLDVPMECEPREAEVISKWDRGELVREGCPQSYQRAAPETQKWPFNEAWVVVYRSHSCQENPGGTRYGEGDRPFNGECQVLIYAGIGLDDY